MRHIGDLAPLNLLEEKNRFFANPRHNPQFTYDRDFTQQQLLSYGLPSEKILQLAQHIIAKAYFRASELDLIAMEGAPVAQDSVTARTMYYLNTYGLDKRFRVRWTNTIASRTSITPTGIAFLLPCDFQEEGFQGMLHHEVGTHALRLLNDERQPWFQEGGGSLFSDHMLTEEGLSVLHAQQAHTNKYLYTAAVRYLAIWHAQQGSFLDVWNAITPFVDSWDRRWTICTRTKRGLKDTLIPGGLTKDVVYLEGSLKMSKWLADHHYNLSPLYFGRIAVEDLHKAIALNPTYQPILPHFYTENIELYAAAIREIAQANGFTEFYASNSDTSPTMKL